MFQEYTTDREAQIQQILSGPDYMDCPAGLGARIPIADCVARQTRGICLQGIPSGWIPEICRDCSAGREALKAYKEGGKGVMGKKESNPMPPVEAVKPDPPPAPPEPLAQGRKTLDPFRRVTGYETTAPSLSAWPEAVSPPPPMPPVKPALAPYPTVVVSFDGHEDLCRRLMAEAEKCRETVSDHLLWLAGVYVKGLDR